MKITHFFRSLRVIDSQLNVDFVIGNRGTKTGLKLWEKAEKFAAGIVATDYCKSYTEIVPAKQLVQTKVETYTIESSNSLIKHLLARFRRKSKCYSKSEKMIENTLKIFFAHRNKTLAIFDY